MIPRILTLAAALASLLLSGCFEKDVVIRINADGSGTITEETIPTPLTVALDYQLQESFGGEEREVESPYDKLVDPDEAAERAAALGEGVTVSTIERIRKNNRKGARIVYKFENVNTIRWDFHDSRPKIGLEKPEESAGDPILTFAHAKETLLVKCSLADLDHRGSEKAFGGENKDFDEDALLMTKGFMKGLKLNLSIETPARPHPIGILKLDLDRFLADQAGLDAFQRAETPRDQLQALGAIDGVSCQLREELTIPLK